MRKRDLERAEREAVVAWRLEKEARIADLERQIEWLKEQHADLLNRCMSKDWTQYTALSAEPQPPVDPPKGRWSDDGLIWLPDEDDDPSGSL